MPANPNHYGRVKGWANTNGHTSGPGGTYTILQVTNLNATGAGSLRAAVEATGARLVVFTVSGNIDLAGANLDISNPYITIAGQTAPVPGITIIKAQIRTLTHNVILEHLKIRPGSGAGVGKDGIETRPGSYDVYFGHLSLSWGTDGTLDIGGFDLTGTDPAVWRSTTSHRITMDRCLIGETLNTGTYGASGATLWEDNANYIMAHGCAWINNHTRCPLLKGGTWGTVINSLIYNSQDKFIDQTLQNAAWTGKVKQEAKLDAVNNYAKAGPQTTSAAAFVEVVSNHGLTYYGSGNIKLRTDGTSYPETLCIANTQPYNTGGYLTIMGAEQLGGHGITPIAANSVPAMIAASVGAFPWARDAIDARLLADFTNGTGAYKAVQAESGTGGYPTSVNNTQAWNPAAWNLTTMEPAMTKAVLKGMDTPNLLITAQAQPSGSGALRYVTDIVNLLGANPLFEIDVGGVVVYRASVVGSLAYSAAGISWPTQFSEPPTVNAVNALTASTAKVRLRHATNAGISIEVPVKAGGAADFLTASGALDGTKAVRTSGVMLAPPSILATGYSGSVITNSMTTGNEGGWYIEAAPNTQDQYGPGGKYPYVNIGLRRSDGRSYYLDDYLSDPTVGQYSLNDSTIINCLPWFVIGRASGFGGFDNVRVQLRNLKRYFLLSDNTWEVATALAPISGANWHATFRSQGRGESYLPSSSGSGLSQIQSHGAEGESIGSVGYGTSSSIVQDGVTQFLYQSYTIHGYSLGVNRTRAQWVSYKAVLYSIEHRLIMHNTAGVDQRPSTNLLVWQGADFRHGGASGPIIDEHCHSRLTRVKNDWAVSVCGEFSNADITAYPPPGF